MGIHGISVFQRGGDLRKEYDHGHCASKADEQWKMVVGGGARVREGNMISSAVRVSQRRPASKAGRMGCRRGHSRAPRTQGFREWGCCVM